MIVVLLEAKKLGLLISCDAIKNSSRQGIFEFITESVHKADHNAGFYELFILWMNVFWVRRFLLWYFNYKHLTLKLVIGRISQVSTSHWTKEKMYLSQKTHLLGLCRLLLKGFLEFWIYFKDQKQLSIWFFPTQNSKRFREPPAHNLPELNSWEYYWNILG